MGEPCGMPRRLSLASVVRVFRPRWSVSSTGQSNAELCVGVRISGRSRWTLPSGPAVSDRIAQLVGKQLIELELDQVFLPDPYGYRPGKSALDAMGITRQLDGEGSPDKNAWLLLERLGF
jgi:retron-type reverse transcriptase